MALFVLIWLVVVIGLAVMAVRALWSGVCWLLIALLVWAGPALAATAQAPEHSQLPATFMRGCNELAQNRPPVNDEEAFDAGMCIATIKTLATTESDFHVWGFCIPPTVAAGQVITSVTFWVNARPARWNEAFIPLVVESLKETWPCKVP